MSFPFVSKELIAALKHSFPNKPIQRNDTHDSLMWRGGEQQVITFLEQKFDEQNSRSEDGIGVYCVPT